MASDADYLVDMLRPGDVAAAVSIVTAWSCGARFVPGSDVAGGGEVPGRVLIFPFQRGRRFGLLLSCDPPAALALAARLTRTDPGAIAPEAVELSLRELLGLIAAHLERTADLTVGPRWSGEAPALCRLTTGQVSEGIALRSNEVPGAHLWIVQRTSAGGPRPVTVEHTRDFQ